MKLRKINKKMAYDWSVGNIGNFFSTLFQKTDPLSKERLIKYNNWAVVIQIINATFQIALVRKSSYTRIAKFFNLFRKEEDKKEISDPPNWKFGVTREYIPKIKKSVAESILDNVQVKTENGFPVDKNGNEIGGKYTENNGNYTDDQLKKMLLESKFSNALFEQVLKDITVTFTKENEKEVIAKLFSKFNDKPNADSAILLIYKNDPVNSFDNDFSNQISNKVERNIIESFEEEIKLFDNGQIPFIRLSNYPFNSNNKDQIKLVKISKDSLQSKIDNNENNFDNLFDEESTDIKTLINKVKVSGNDNRSSSNRLETKCLGKVPVAETMALFSVLTAVSHLVISSRPRYFGWIKHDQINYLRWLEYSITSSIMVFGLSGLCGITQSEELVPIAILTGVTNIFGLAIEAIKNFSFQYNYLTPSMSPPDEKDVITGFKNNDLNADHSILDLSNNFNTIKKILFVTACITHSYPWARILFKLNSGINSFGSFDEYIKKAENTTSRDNNEFNLTKKVFGKRLERFSKISPLIKAATWGLAAIYWVFPLNMINQQFRSNENPSFKKYYRGELNYIIISMVAKSFLTWVIWSGSLRDGEGRADLDSC